MKLEAEIAAGQPSQRPAAGEHGELPGALDAVRRACAVVAGPDAAALAQALRAALADMGSGVAAAAVRPPLPEPTSAVAGVPPVDPAGGSAAAGSAIPAPAGDASPAAPAAPAAASGGPSLLPSGPGCRASGRWGTSPDRSGPGSDASGGSESTGRSRSGGRSGGRRRRALSADTAAAVRAGRQGTLHAAFQRP